jgi:sporulation protein YlmC with PRC-barrel domain
MQPQALSASTIIGDTVRNRLGEDLGHIKELMLDVEDGRIAYAVLSFGGILGIGDKLFAVPWRALELRPEERTFYLDVDKEQLENAPGFDKDNWPMTLDREFMTEVHSYYGIDPYWGETVRTGPGTTGTGAGTGATETPPPGTSESSPRQTDADRRRGY